MLRWLTVHEDPRTFGLFRILLGVLLLANVGALWPHAEYLYGDIGVMPAQEVCGDGIRVLSAMCHLPGTVGAHVVLGGFMVSTLAFILGLYTRVAKWTTAFLFLSIVLRNGVALAGEQVFGNFLFLLCLSRCGAAYSVDAWLRRRRLGGVEVLPCVPAWPRHLMVLQLCLAYGVAGWAKTGQTWVEGTSFYYVLANDRWFRFEPWWLLSTFGTHLLRGATWGAWWFERLFPLVGLGLLLGGRLRWLRVVGSRWIWATLSLVFTGTLAVLTNIGWFVPATMAATLVLFRGDEVGLVMARLRRHAFVAAAPCERTGPTWRTQLLAAFVGWHALAMLVNSFSLPHLRAPIPEALRSATRSWGRITNTFQFWGMFSPNAPVSRSWLVVDVVTEDGSVEPAFDDRKLIGERRHPYVFVDRRQKAHAKVRSARDGYRDRHARYVCRTWRDAHGRAPAQVVLSAWHWPLPDPRFMAAHGPIDPRPFGERYRREEELHRRRCDPP